MENEPESITQLRVRMYNKALAELREENALAEREAERTKEAEAQSGKDSDVETAKKAEDGGSGQESSDKA